MKSLRNILYSMLLVIAPAVRAELPVKRVITLNVAKKIAAAAEAEANRRHLTAVIVVVDDGGYPLLLQRLDNTQVASVEVGIGKARTAAIFQRPVRTLRTKSKTDVSRRWRCQELRRYKVEFRSSSTGR